MWSGSLPAVAAATDNRTSEQHVIEHPHPTVATVKLLYAQALYCAFPGCREPLYREDEMSGKWVLNSRVSHICARSEGGPRWDPLQSAEANRSEANLVLMCTKHAGAIDDALTVSHYPAALLRDWKSAQVEEHRQRREGWPLTTAMAGEALTASFKDVAVAINNSVVNLGGEGGRAPGSGGGGGGAIGPGARGGRGGNAGRITDLDGNPVPEEDWIKFLDGATAAPAPGSGGPGAGAIGPNAIGGDGGDGGEGLAGQIKLQPGDIHEVTIGAGGEPPRLPGQHGTPGGDTTLTIKSPDGTVKRVLRVRGGAAARAGTLPDDWLTISENDLRDGFQISTLLAVNSFDVRDGLVYILGGGFARMSIPSLPHHMVWAVVCGATWNYLTPLPMRGLQVCLTAPNGTETSRIALPLPQAASNGLSWIWTIHLGAPLDLEGNWRISVQSGEHLLSEIYISVTLQEGQR